MSTTWKPHPYQLHAAQHALNNPGAALFLEPGLGKTAISLAVVSVLKRERVTKGVLVIAPLRVCFSVWPKEGQKWAEFNALSVGVLHDDIGQKKAKTLREKHDVYVINPDGLKWLAAELKVLGSMPFDMLIVDESTKFKHASTARFKLLKTMLPKFKRRLLLTGTPAANNLQDLFGQVYLIDNGARLGKFITHFRRTYFDEERHWMGFSIWHPRDDTAIKIEERVRDVCMYMRAEDLLTMPKRFDNRISVTLPADVQRVYAKVESDFYADLGTDSINAAHAATAGMKLRQIVGGQVYTDDRVAHLHTVKLDALADLIEEQSGQPILVAVAFKHEAEAIRAMLARDFKIDAPYLGGGISATKSDQIAAQFNAGTLPVLLAHPASVAHGLNLQAAAKAVCWFTLTWNLEEYDQLNRRVYRQGQQHTVVIHHIIADGTIDEVVYAALVAKDKTQRNLLDALKLHAEKSTLESTT